MKKVFLSLLILSSVLGCAPVTETSSFGIQAVKTANYAKETVSGKSTVNRTGVVVVSTKKKEVSNYPKSPPLVIGKAKRW